MRFQQLQAFGSFCIRRRAARFDRLTRQQMNLAERYDSQVKENPEPFHWLDIHCGAPDGIEQNGRLGKGKSMGLFRGGEANGVDEMQQRLRCAIV